MYIFPSKLLFLVLCNSPDHPLTLIANCDWIMKVFLDGVEYHDPATMLTWVTTSTLTVPSGTRVLAIECDAESWVGGILASLSNGQVTDHTWKCSAVYEPGWTEPDFEPTSPNWTPAFEIVENGGSMPTWTWAECTACSSRAMWIWTPDFRNDMPGYVSAYCRVNIGNQYMAKRFLKTYLPETHVFKCEFDKMLKLSELIKLQYAAASN